MERNQNYICIEFHAKQHQKKLTSAHSFQWIEECYQQIHEDGEVKGDAAPKGHVTGTPVQDGLSWRRQQVKKFNSKQ